MPRRRADRFFARHRPGPAPGEWPVATPALHHWHHTLDGHTQKNYAAVLPWLDRLFGTFHLPARLWPTQYGTGTPVGTTLGEQLLRPLPANAPCQPLCHNLAADHARQRRSMRR